MKVKSMPNQFTASEIIILPKILSIPRFGRYLAACCMNRRQGLALYRWNAQVSAAFLFPLSICEVAIRNAIVEALERVHGVVWPWSAGFEQSLPHPCRGYSPRQDLIETRDRYNSAAQIVAELKSVFWESMLTSRHDGRLWKQHLRATFPGMPANMSPKDCRTILHTQASKVRTLRNRIAHHEPVFSRELASELERICCLIKWRSPEAAAWIRRSQTVGALLSERS